MTAKVPAVPDYGSADPGLSRWVSAVNNALKALRDADLITQADIDDMIRKANASISTSTRANAADITVDAGGIIPITTLVDKLLANQKFKDSLGGTVQNNTAQSGAGGASTSDLYTLEQAALTAQKSAESAAAAAAQAQTLVNQVKATTRGPIRSTGVASSWSDTTAAQCVYWMQYNGGTGSPPSFPANVAAYLVVGDMVAMRDQVSGPSTWFEAKQWLGSTIGWTVTPNSLDFNDVINLPTLLSNVNAVIDANLRLVKTTQVAGANLKPGAGGTVPNPTLAQITNEFDYTAPNTQAYNTLQALIDLSTRMASVEAKQLAHGW